MLSAHSAYSAYSAVPFPVYHPPEINEAWSTPVLQAVRHDGTFRLSVTTSSSKTYVLEYKDALAEPDWKPLLSVPGDGTAKVLTDPFATTSQRFYRVRVE